MDVVEGARGRGMVGASLACGAAMGTVVCCYRSYTAECALRISYWLEVGFEVVASIVG